MKDNGHIFLATHETIEKGPVYIDTPNANKLVSS